MPIVIVLTIFVAVFLALIIAAVVASLRGMPKLEKTQNEEVGRSGRRVPDFIETAIDEDGEFSGSVLSEAQLSLESVDLSGLDSISARIVGMGFHASADFLRALRESSAKLIREPENPHDSNAILVSMAGRKVGYVSKGRASGMAAILDTLPPRAYTVDVDSDLRMVIPRLGALRAFFETGVKPIVPERSQASRRPTRPKVARTVGEMVPITQRAEARFNGLSSRSLPAPRLGALKPGDRLELLRTRAAWEVHDAMGYLGDARWDVTDHSWSEGRGVLTIYCVVYDSSDTAFNFRGIAVLEGAAPESAN